MDENLAVELHCAIQGADELVDGVEEVKLTAFIEFIETVEKEVLPHMQRASELRERAERARQEAAELREQISETCK